MVIMWIMVTPNDAPDLAYEFMNDVMLQVLHVRTLTSMSGLSGAGYISSSPSKLFNISFSLSCCVILLLHIVSHVPGWT